MYNTSCITCASNLSNSCKNTTSLDRDAWDMCQVRKRLMSKLAKDVVGFRFAPAA